MIKFTKTFFNFLIKLFDVIKKLIKVAEVKKEDMIKQHSLVS